MTNPLCPGWANVPKPVIGMLHLPALPGSPSYGGDLSSIRDLVLRDARALCDGGVNGLMLENFGDTPFFAGSVPTHTVTHMTSLAQSVRDVSDLPLGINVLRNDGLSALAIALAVGADYIRVNVLSGACLTDQGVITGNAAELMRYRQQIGADHIKVLADVRVKHAAPLADRPIEEEVDELVQRAAADGVIVSGVGTGHPTDPQMVKQVKRSALDTPVFIGSGATPQTLAELLPHADGFIVGSYFKMDGQLDQPVDVKRVKAFLDAVHV
jgi:membrane complex biogenesis BtpA family protein